MRALLRELVAVDALIALKKQVCSSAGPKNQTPTGGGSGGRIKATDNWEEECCQSIGGRWEEECAAPNFVTKIIFEGFRKVRAGTPSPALRKV